MPLGSLPAIEFVVPSIGLLIFHALGPKCQWSGYDIHDPVLTLLGHRQVDLPFPLPSYQGLTV